MSAQGRRVNTPLMVLALGRGLVLHCAGQRSRENRGEPASPLVPRQAARTMRPVPVRVSGSELTDMIDATEKASCPQCGLTLTRGCDCDTSECARLLASAF